jgi:molybdopterin molybdotransferase
VVGSVAAGTVHPDPLRPGEAVRIMTGAPVPPGANAVVRLEWCSNATDTSVEVVHAVAPGESIQPRGDDGRAGDVLLMPGVRISPGHLALCRAFGIGSLTVAAAPTCSVIVTGTELVTGTDGADGAPPLPPGRIYGSNDAFLRGALTADELHVRQCETLSDDRRQIRQALAAACAQSDVVITTGGVSAGDYDYLPGILQELSGHLHVRKVLIRPGAPFVAAKVGAATVFALSGNPAASFVQFETLVRPVLRAALGWADEPFPASGKLLHDMELKPVQHTRILRAHASIHQGEVLVDAQMPQSSGQVSSFSKANCLIRLDAPSVPKGTVVPLRWLDYAR